MVFQGCFKEVSKKFPRSLKEVSRVCQESFKGISRKFQGSFHWVLRVLKFQGSLNKDRKIQMQFQGSFECVPRKSHGCSKNGFRVLQVSLKGV